MGHDDDKAGGQRVGRRPDALAPLSPEAAGRLRADRERQCLPPAVKDVVVLARVAAVLRGSPSKGDDTLAEARARLRDERERRGLPPVVTDNAVLGTVAALPRAAETEQ